MINANVSSCLGHVNVTEVLIRNGAIINAEVGNNKDIPLHISTENGKFLSDQE